MGASETKTPVYRVVVLGVEGVGKSSLTSQFVNNTFVETDPTIEDVYRTVLKVNKKKVNLNILDTAGEDVTTRDEHIGSGDGFILVYSINDPSSLMELIILKDAVRSIKGNTFPIVLVGNKIDLEDSKNVDQKMLDLITIGCSHFEASAKNRINVEESFIGLVKQIEEMNRVKVSRKK
eukprot:TRINITY_DN3591_c0_g1_i1.p1 TRINITY_DN3591_c0_g1~~TRINITY_DN3591_c0_g1_i1.p1  ORF type:complete len:178 (+),score=21.06 TRINITY_DN3591_c0_g1_i1:140-673(+)